MYILILVKYNTSARTMLFPYENKSTLRTYNEFLQDAQLAALESDRTGREVIVNGVRGVSPLLSILQHPVCVVYDYMHHF